MVDALLQPVPEHKRAKPLSRRTRRALGLIGSCLLLVTAVGAYLGPLGENFHPVIPGKVYRSGQPTAESLHNHACRDGIRSVINLRGPNQGEDWYEQERAEAHQQDMRFYDLPVDSKCPTPTELGELLRVLEMCPKPVLIHCQSGIDRSGLVAAICILLLDEHGSMEQAQAHLGWRYGHMPWCDNLSVQERFLQNYQHWLVENRLSHDCGRFRDWLLRTAGSTAARDAASADR